MKITHSEVEHVADLARLTFSPEEMDSITGQLNDILTYVAQLEKVEASGVEPTTHALEVENAFREDETGKSLSADEALSNAPEREDDTFVVPRII